MANQFIPYGRQHITQTDIDAVVAVLQSDFLTQGSQVPAFEERVATYTGAKAWSRWKGQRRLAVDHANYLYRIR